MKQALAAVAALGMVAVAGPASAQTVILARHAEKADQGEDPLLSDAGMARAAGLAAALGESRLTHVFVTPLQRTDMTGAPSARAHGLVTEAVSFDGGTEGAYIPA